MVKPLISLGATALLLSGCAQAVCGGVACIAPPIPAQVKIVSVGTGLEATNAAAYSYAFDSPASTSTIALERANGYTGAIDISAIDLSGTGDTPCSEISIGALTAALTFTATAISAGSCQIVVATRRMTL